MSGGDKSLDVFKLRNSVADELRGMVKSFVRIHDKVMGSIEKFGKEVFPLVREMEKANA